MAFPQDPLDVAVELQAGGTWTDITDDVYHRDQIEITRGRADEGSHVDPGKCTLTLNNREGTYSPRNPLSPYYGLIGRNTPIRVSVLHGDTYLALSGESGSQASTPDAAALDLTGDLDIRIDATLENWNCGSQILLCGKYDPDTANRSWLLRTSSDGTVLLTWSTDGVALLQAASTSPIAPPPSGRLAIRATLDVNDGAGGHLVTFYTSTSIGGSWTQLGDVYQGVGTTSVFASTAPLDCGWVFDQDGFISPSGRIHAMQLLNGIGGSAVANPDFAAQTPGATSFVDAAGRTWSPAGDASLTNRQTRFTGEVSSWPPRWDVSGKDVYVPIEAAGLLRRLGQGASPLSSPLRREVLPRAPLAYWPMEDEDGATVAGNAAPGGSPLAVTGFDFAAEDTLAGSRPLPTVGTAMTGTVPAPATTTLEWQVNMVVRIDTAPSAGTDQELLRVSSAGTVASWRIGDDATNLTLTGYSSTGAVLVTATLAHATFPGFHGAWSTITLHAVNAGIDTDWTFIWGSISDLSSVSTSGTVAGAVGHITGVTTAFGAGLAGASVGHLAVFDHATTQVEYATAAGGSVGEQAGARVLRMATEEGLTATLVTTTSPQTELGAQAIDTLLKVLEDAADADGGIIYEQRESVGLRYRDRTSLYSQDPVLALDYAVEGEVAPPLEPNDDDQATRNDVSVARAGGASARAVLETGALSILAPPDGVGRYEESITLNLYSDDQCANIASWHLHLGTWDEARYPTVHVDLAAGPHLITDALAVDLRDLLTIDNPPAWLPPDQIRLLAEGYTETIGLYDWDIVYNCSPAGPWDVAVLSDTTLGRLDTGGSELAASATSSATSLTAATTDGPAWTVDPADCPFDLVIAGERVTVTAVAPWASDTYTRSVSSGWGTATSGQAWTSTGGSASDYSVTGSVGQHSLSTISVSRWSSMTAVHAGSDTTITVSTSGLSTGASQFVALAARWTSDTDYYSARLEFTTAQAVVLSLRKRVAGVDTELAAVTLASAHVAAGQIKVRLQVRGSTLRANAWPVASAEPHGWQLTTIDTDITGAGSIALRSIRSTGNTNSPMVSSWDDLTTASPQVLTVTRSANGVVKAQSAGADVRLFQPMILAL